MANVAGLYHEKTIRGSSIEIISKIIDTNLTDAEKEQFVSTFGPISDTVRIEPMMGWSNPEASTTDWKTIAANNPSNLDISVPAMRLVCPDPFAKLSINYNGTVSICCVDWSHGTLVGDVNHETVEQVWRGERLKEFRLMHLKGKRDCIKACKNCDYMQNKSEHDNLDHDRERLITRFSAADPA